MKVLLKYNITGNNSNRQRIVKISIEIKFSFGFRSTPLYNNKYNLFRLCIISKCKSHSWIVHSETILHSEWPWFNPHECVPKGAWWMPISSTWSVTWISYSVDYCSPSNGHSVIIALVRSTCRRYPPLTRCGMLQRWLLFNFILFNTKEAVIIIWRHWNNIYKAY